MSDQGEPLDKQFLPQLDPLRPVWSSDPGEIMTPDLGAVDPVSDGPDPGVGARHSSGDLRNTDEDRGDGHSDYDTAGRPGLGAAGLHARPEPSTDHEPQFRPTVVDSAPASAWAQVDNLRSADLVPKRKVVPARGWRKALYRSSFGLINPGPSRDERYQAELEERVRALLRGNFKIGVFGRGGAGKTVTATCVGSVFAALRQNDRVVALDADTAFGKLGSRVDPESHGSYWELVGDRHLYSFQDVRARVGANAAGLFVLAGESATARRRVLDPQMYRDAARLLDQHFGLSIIDCGSSMDTAVTAEVLTDLDAAIVLSSPWMDGGEVALQTMSWLANNGHTALLNRTVAVINDSDGHSSKKTRAVLAEEFTSRGHKVIEVPFDTHLRHGAVVDVANEMNPKTRRRFLELAAILADYFASTTEAPRQRP